ITAEPRIEPALSARSLVESLAPVRRAAFLRGDRRADPPVPRDVASRIEALLRAVGAPRGHARLVYFGALLDAAFPDPDRRAAGIAAEYLRVMAFDYQKEFVAQKDASPAAAVAELYRRRGLSTDTAVEAGYVVHLGLGVLKALDPARRLRRVLIIGPGLDLAPRTALDEAAAPESYQPWAVLDAVLSLGLGRADDLEVVAADINPRVVAHLRRSREHPPLLRVATSLRQGPTLTLSPDYVEYVDRFGAALAELPPGAARDLGNGERGKIVSVAARSARSLHAAALDIVTERLPGERFDLIIATNILPYFDDPQLALALANISAMLLPGGAFLHNEQRPVLGEFSAALGLPLQQARHAVIATVTGANAPLYDSVFLHVRTLGPR
ncbi:MAG: class I SAM-dependent methyltransferase, partial [Vicinamibacteraceae bacterium]